LVVFGASVSEAASGVVAVSAQAQFFASIQELVNTQDSSNAVASFLARVVETGRASDVISCRYLWEPVDDNQTSNWQNVNDAQGATWAVVNDSQAGSWQVVNDAQGSNWVEVTDSQTPVWQDVETST
jgi:hypothetical protein